MWRAWKLDGLKKKVSFSLKLGGNVASRKRWLGLITSALIVYLREIRECHGSLTHWTTYRCEDEWDYAHRYGFIRHKGQDLQHLLIYAHLTKKKKKIQVFSRAKSNACNYSELLIDLYQRDLDGCFRDDFISSITLVGHNLIKSEATTALANAIANVSV